MIAGFNTDIEHNGVVYHIQTEDKGLQSQLIVSLVYDKGTILASKRTPYDDLNVEDLDESAVADRLSRQHKLICAAVKAGRISDLQEMTGRNRVRPAAQPASNAPDVETANTVVNLNSGPLAAEIQTPVVTVSTQELAFDMPPAIPQPDSMDDFLDLPVFSDAVTIIEEADLMPEEAIEVVSELSGIERPKHDRLSIDILGETKFKGGDRVTLNIMICRGTDRRVLAGAQIMVKVLGSMFRPIIFHARSDANGLATVHLQLPSFQAGRAAMLIRVIADGEETELRRIVNPG